MNHHFVKIVAAGLTVFLTVLACSVSLPVEPAITPTVAIATALPPLSGPATATTAPVPPTPGIGSLTPLASPAIQSIDMLDANNGWALTDKGAARTADGGSTWYDATPAGYSGRPASAFFLDPANAWVAVMGTDPTNGTLFHTTDGGATWSSISVPFGGGSLKFVDPLNGWELIGLNAGMSHEAVAVYRTADGGKTWTRSIINDPTVTGSSDSLPLVGDKNGITALDTTHAWVTGAQPSDNFVYIYASQDGGITWAHQDFALPTGYDQAMTSAELPQFFGSHEGVLPVMIFANTNASEFYVSHDGGQTWAATTAVPQGGFLAVASSKDFFVWDGSTPLNASHDGGSTWSSVTPNVNIKDTMVSFQFINATTGWALANNASNQPVLYKTTDGGTTWNALTQ